MIHFLFSEDLDALTTRALATPQPEHSFLEKIMGVTEHHYRHFAKDPTLSRVLLSEILVESPGLMLPTRLCEVRDKLAAKAYSGRTVAEDQLLEEL